MALDDFDRRLIGATQSGLPLVSRPYEAVGAVLGVSGEMVRERFAQLIASAAAASQRRRRSSGWRPSTRRPTCCCRAP